MRVAWFRMTFVHWAMEPREATVEVLEEALTEMSGLPSIEGPPLVHCSDGVRDVRMGVPRPVGRCG